MLLTEIKTCTKCSEEKEIGDFHRMSRSRDGRRPSCKLCHCAQQKAYQEQHRDLYVECSARHYVVNRDSRLLYQREYEADHVEQRRERMSDPVARSRATERQRLREAKIVGYLAEHVDRMVVFQRDEGICGICSRPADVKCFHVDHIVPLSKGGVHSYDNVQVAHPICNSIKGARLNFVLLGS